MASNAARVSVIVPVHNNPRDLPVCLHALKAAAGMILTDVIDRIEHRFYKWVEAEIIVVDDASTDDTPTVAAESGVRVLQLTKKSGPGAARNYGVAHSFGEIVFFVDSDIAVAADAIRRVMQIFDNRPEVAAVFGSYDNRPRAKGLVSQYRNLLHHFVHQNGNPDASTFWGGCGAVRRSVFEAVGGFDEEFRPVCSVDDIELGYRIIRSGHRIFLDKELQGTHLKRWTFRSVILADITHRAIPWSRLIIENHNAPKDLNLKITQRISVLLVILACVFLLLGLVHVKFVAFAAPALLTVGILNRDLYAFFYRQRGLFFAGACVPLHLLYYVYSSLSYLFVWATFQIRKLTAVRLISALKSAARSPRP
jgi:GT2 family glycosyltransferase